jgi:DNA-binding CsgD family transcriptional regulator
MTRSKDRTEPTNVSVLLFAHHPAGRPYVRALEKATIPVEWVRTAGELQSRLNRADLPRPAVVLVLPSHGRFFEPNALADLARRLSMRAQETPRTQDGAPPLDRVLEGYCATRGISPRQKQVLELYLTGSNDKEIADLFRCAEATVYEHWRRMARKANGAHKSDVVTDFHRFLAEAGALPRSALVPE